MGYIEFNKRIQRVSYKHKKTGKIFQIPVNAEVYFEGGTDIEKITFDEIIDEYKNPKPVLPKNNGEETTGKQEEVSKKRT